MIPGLGGAPSTVGAERAAKRAQPGYDQFEDEGRIDPDRAEKDPGGVQGTIIDMQRDDFETRFKPLESKLMKMVGGNGNKEANQAGTNVRKQSRITRKTFMRDLERSGTQLTERQGDTIDRKRGLDVARGVANAKNTTRANVRDENTQRKADLIGIGRGVQQGANDSLSAAAGMQANRETAGRNAQAAESAQNSQMIATGVGLVASFFL